MILIGAKGIANSTDYVHYNEPMISSQIIQSCLSGDEDAIQTFVRSHQRAVYQLALSILDDASGSQVTIETSAEAEAATRQTFSVALSRLSSYREEMPFEPWLYTIAIREIRKRARSRGLRRLLGRVNRGEPGSYAQPPAGDNTAPADPLWESVRRLNEKYRLPVILRYYHDLPVAQIAQILRISEGVVHARLDTAREKIAGSVEETV
jgi:RNA polymerase sigma-70 factor, ECF subfamily